LRDVAISRGVSPYKITTSGPGAVAVPVDVAINLGVRAWVIATS